MMVSNRCAESKICGSRDWTLLVDYSHTCPGVHDGGGVHYVETGFGEIDFYSEAGDENSS